MCLELDTFRRTRYAVTLLILAMALFVSAETAFLSNVQAEPTVTLSPTNAIPGTLITVTLSTFATGDTSCTISGTPVSNPSSCRIANIPSATFTVAQYTRAGTYTITVTGNTGDTGQASFTVDGFDLALTPMIGETGTNVGFTLSNVPGYDTSCSVSSPTRSSAVTVAGCAVSSGVGNGTFIIGNVPVGDYVIEVTACTGNSGCGPSAGDFAQQVFNVTSAPQIILIPTYGETGTSVQIEGGFFSPSDTTCTLSSSSSGSFIKNPSCSIFITTLGYVNVTGSFIVGNVPIGQYLVRVTGSPVGDFAEAVFNVTSGPFIQLGVSGVFVSVGQVASGTHGTHVSIEGSNFLPNDALSGATCSLSSPSSSIVNNGACSFFVTPSGFVNATGSFVVGNVPEGQYVIRVSGSAGDSAQAVFNVTAGAFIQLGVSGVFVSVGQVASGPIGTHVAIEGSNFLANDAFNSATCSVSSPTSGTVVNNGACSFFKTPLGWVNATGSFVVGNVPEGQYVIRVTGSAGDSAQAVFNVTAGAFIQLGVFNRIAGEIVVTPLGQVTSGPVGTDVSIEGSQFLANDAFSGATCSVSSPTNGVIVLNGACSFFKTTNGWVNATGSFTVGKVLPGQYVIRVSGSAGDSAEAIFNVTVGPSISLSPGSGRIGTHVQVNGTGFLPTDGTCTISGPSSSIVTVAGCSIQLGTGDPGGSFTVGNVSPGQYVIQVTGNQGDYAQFVFNVTIGATLTLSPGSGEIGTHVLVNGTGFLPTDHACAISSPTSGFITAQGCAVVYGSGVTGGSFTVGDVLPGQYVVQVTGSPGTDYAQAVFNITVGAAISLSPGTAPPGHSVIVNGTSFLPTDTACTITSPSPNVVESGSAACVTRAGTGVVSGSFIVGNVVPGQYVIQVTGDRGDFAQAALNVTGGPQLTLSPGSGPIGMSIIVNGTGFLTTDQSCSISSISKPSPILVGSAGCAVTVGTGIVRGSFVIGSVAVGEYVIEVTACAGNNGCAPSAGDFAQDVVTVVSGPASLTLYPTSAVEGATVTFIGAGLSPSDTGCTLLVYNTGAIPPTVDDNLITSQTCSITTPGGAQGSFVVSPYATADIAWGLTVQGTPALDCTPTCVITTPTSFAVFTVTPDVIVTPTSGTVNTVFTFTGSGFLSTATTCTATVVPTPPFPAATPSCAIDNGQVSGSVVVPQLTVSGTYGISVTDGTYTATGVFTVGTPSALVVLNPATVGQGQPVGVAGFGFNPSDAYCTISSTAGTALFGAVTPTCLISSGYASGSFTVSTTAAGGYYLISVVACLVAPTPPNVCPAGDSLDFASNFLGVTLATTVATYSTTTSSSTTLTSLSTTTTSVGTYFTYYTTTYQTTGIFFTTYTQFTESTVSGMTTTSYTQTTSTTQTQTTVTFTTTTSFTTVPCGPLPCGLTIQPAPMNLAPGIESAGLLVALLLLLPMLLRRLFT